MAERVYIETTVVSYLTARPSRDLIIAAHQQIRRVRDAHAASFNYDLHAIFRDIKKREKERGLVFVDGVARQPMPKQPSTPGAAAIPVSREHQALPSTPAVEP